MVILVLVLGFDAVRGLDVVWRRRGKGWRGLENLGGLGATSPSSVLLEQVSDFVSF